MPGALPCPNCGCEPPLVCELFTDDFNRADTSSLGADYSEASGDWEITSNRLNPPASGILKVTLSTPVSPNGVKIAAVCNFIGTGEMSLCVDYVDTNNYTYATVVSTGATTAKMRIWQVVGGTPTALTTDDTIPSFSWTTDFTLEVCWDGQSVGALYTQGANTLSQGAVIGTPNGGNFTALRTASVNTSARFDDLAVTSLQEGCERCGAVCTQCEHATFQIDIAGITNGTCTDCADANKSYIVKRIQPDSDCIWGLGLVDLCGFTDSYFVAMTMGTGQLNALLAPMPYAGGGAAIISWKSTSLSPNCESWIEEDIPHFADEAFPHCIGTASTFKVTAL